MSQDMTVPSALLAEQLEAALGYIFKDKILLEQALTHRSCFSGEKSDPAEESYERLEFLGDRVLGLAIADLLYRTFPGEPEGDLSKRLIALVNRQTLADIAIQADLPRFLKLSPSEERNGGRKRSALIADMTEAVIGALYLDDRARGGQAAFRFIETYWTERLTAAAVPPHNPKSVLQEWCMARGLNLPDYQHQGHTGPDHAPEFKVMLVIAGYPPLTARGSSKQAAEQQAAIAMLAQLESGDVSGQDRG